MKQFHNHRTIFSHYRISRYIMAALLLLFAGCLMNARTISAASAEIEIAADPTPVTAGEKVVIYINIKSDTMFGDFEANLTYDDEIMEYQSGLSFITGSSGFLKIADTNFSDGSDTRKYALEFKALKAGTSEISFSGPAMVYDYESGFPMSVSSSTLSLEVSAPKTASENALLKSLKVSPSTLTPEFDKSIYNYSATVGYETEKLIIEALTEDEKATVKISGNDLLQEGENKVIVTVIAETGVIIEYTIDVFRGFAPVQEEEVDITITPASKHGSFEVVHVNNELFAVYGGKYKLITPAADVKIPYGYIKTKIIISGNSIDVYAPENNLESDFLLIYAMNELEEAGFYRYDRVERTLQRYEEDESSSPNKVTDLDQEKIMDSKEYRSNLNKAAIVIALLSTLCALFIIISIRLYLKSKGYREDDLD